MYLFFTCFLHIYTCSLHLLHYLYMLVHVRYMFFACSLHCFCIFYMSFTSSLHISTFSLLLFTFSCWCSQLASVMTPAELETRRRFNNLRPDTPSVFGFCAIRWFESVEVASGYLRKTRWSVHKVCTPGTAPARLIIHPSRCVHLFVVLGPTAVDSTPFEMKWNVEVVDAERPTGVQVGLAPQAGDA